MYIRFMFASLFLWMSSLQYSSSHNRVKRLVWPPGGDKIQMIAGVGIPVDLRQETVIFGLVYKAAYALPNNITQLQNSNTIYQRKARSVEHSQKEIIKYLESFLYVQNQFSKECVLKTICEAALSNFDEDGGFINEIMNIVFGSMKDMLKHHDDLDYMKAYNLGTQRPYECGKIYSNCRNSLLNTITIEHENIV